MNTADPKTASATRSVTKRKAVRITKDSITTAVLCLASGALSGVLLVMKRNEDGSFWILWLPGILFGLAWGIPNLKGDFRLTFAVTSAVAYYAAASIKVYWATHLVTHDAAGYILASLVGVILLCIACWIHGFELSAKRIAVLAILGIGVGWIITPLAKATQAALPPEWLHDASRVWTVMGITSVVCFCAWQCIVGGSLAAVLQVASRKQSKSQVGRLLGYLAGSKFVTGVGAIATIWSIVDFLKKWGQ